MSATATAQEQSAPPATPPQIDMAQANTINEQIATARMSGAGKDAIQELEGQLASALGAAPVQPPAVEPKEQQPPAEAPPAEVPPEAPTEEPPAEPATPPAPEVEPSDRIRLGKEYSDADKALVNAAHMLVKGGQAKTFSEAFARVSGLGQPAAVEPEPEVAEVPPEITLLQQQVAAAEATVEAIEAEEGLYGPSVGKANRELNRLVAKLEAKLESQEAAAKLPNIKGEVDDVLYRKAQDTILQETIKEFPQAADKEGPLWLLADAIAKKALAEGHPLHDKLFGLEAPRFFIQEAARQIGLKPASVPSTPQPPKPTQAAPKTPIAPVAPGSRGTIVQPQATSQDLIKMVEGNLASVLAGTGGTIKPSHAPPKVIMLR